jgi:CheY-like chemotaxis protein
LLKGILSETGARLFEAENGEDALEICTRHQHEIDLVVLDVIMPGMKGDEVLRRIRKIREDMRSSFRAGS